MPEIEIRPAIASDIPQLIALDHDYTSDYVWQMNIQREEGQVSVSFRQARLPRSVRVEYPRSPQSLTEDWKKRAGLLVALLAKEPVGYISLAKDVSPSAAWVTDLVVMRRTRRQGIGSGLVLAAQEWARQHNLDHIVLEMQPKNYAAISLAHKLGFEFCGYNDRYYDNRDIALLFARSVR